MKKLLLFLVILLAMGGSLFAQIQTPPIVRFDGFIAPAGFPNGPANVAVCAAGGSGGPPCSPLTLIYSDQNGITQQTNPFQSFANGRYTFFAPAGTYVVQTYGTGYTTVLTTITLTASASAGGGISPNSPVPAASQQGPAYNVRNYGAVGDAKSSNNCASTATTTITNADNPWVAGDVGKKFQMVVAAVSDFGAAGGGNANNEVTITTFNSAGSIVVSAAATQTGTGTCVWYTQQDHVAMLAAYTAADCGAQTAREPAYGSPTICRPGSVFIPKGGYVVCRTIYNDIAHVGNNTEGVSLIGEPGTDIYLAPCFVPPNGSASVGTLILAYLNQRAEFGHLSIFGMGFLNTNFSPGQYVFGTLSSGKSWIHDVGIYNFGSSQGGTSAAFGMVTTSALSRIDNLQVQNAPNGDITVGCNFDTVGVDIYSSFCSNHFINFKVAGSGQRTVFGPHFVLHGYQNDECGANGLACFQIITSTVNCIGCELLNPGSGVASASLDTTSSLYLTDSTLLTYDSDAGNSSAIVLAGNAQVFASQSNFAGNNTSAAIAGPSTSSFISAGGNKWFNQAAGVQTACTAANYATCAFSGGIVPKSSETHTPNTCYAVTGNLLATAQNICTFANDQNYQVLNITAQSGGTTPTNSACATPPVITLSDGTRTATLTMTTAKTQWSSAVDASTVNTVFASGTTLTISIGANTCATPPVNVAVSYVLQSVLNP